MNSFLKQYLRMPTGAIEGVMLVFFRGLIGLIIVRLTFDLLGPRGIVGFSNFQNIFSFLLSFFCTPLLFLGNVIFSADGDSNKNAKFIQLVSKALTAFLPISFVVTYLLSKYVTLSAPLSILALIAIFLFPLSSAIGGALNGMHLHRAHLYSGVIGSLLLLVWNLIFIKMMASDGVFLAFASSAMVTFIPFFYYAIKYKIFDLNFKSHLREMLPPVSRKLRNGLIISIWAGIFGSLLPLLSRYLISLNLDLNEVGNWQASQKLSDVTGQFISAAISFSLINKFNQNLYGLTDLKRGIKKFSYVILLVSGSLFFLASPINQYLFGQKYSSDMLIKSQAFVDIAKFTYMITSAYCVTKGHLKLQLFCDFLVISVVVITTVLTIDMLGAISVQLAQLLGYSAAIVFFMRSKLHE